MPWLIGLGAMGIILLLIILYNRLVSARNMVREAWSGIDVQLKRRSDLIPRLVETVRGYSGHEQSLYEDIARQRARAIQAQSTEDKGQAENALSQGLKSLFALVEAYPQLKASANYLALQQELIETEDQIQLARRYYNGAVRLFNNRVQSFPANILAGTMGFSPAEFFTLELATEGEAPAIDLDR